MAHCNQCAESPQRPDLVCWRSEHTQLVWAVAAVGSLISLCAVSTNTGLVGASRVTRFDCTDRCPKQQQPVAISAQPPVISIGWISWSNWLIVVLLLISENQCVKFYIECVTRYQGSKRSKLITHSPYQIANSCQIHFHPIDRKRIPIGVHPEDSANRSAHDTFYTQYLFTHNTFSSRDTFQ
jgi:hypothetical protein